MMASIPTATGPDMGRGQTNTIWFIDDYPYHLRPRLARKLSRMQVRSLTIKKGDGSLYNFQFK